jgi:hypothetical protein
MTTPTGSGRCLTARALACSRAMLRCLAGFAASIAIAVPAQAHPSECPAPETVGMRDFVTCPRLDASKLDDLSFEDRRKVRVRYDTITGCPGFVIEHEPWGNSWSAESLERWKAICASGPCAPNHLRRTCDLSGAPACD